jgi:hypothetical protein
MTACSPSGEFLHHRQRRLLSRRLPRGLVIQATIEHRLSFGLLDTLRLRPPRELSHGCWPRSTDELVANIQHLTDGGGAFGFIIGPFRSLEPQQLLIDLAAGLFAE